MDINKDYYKILGVDSSATTEEIKASYRKLAMKYHPDRNPGNEEYEEIFKGINEAYGILKNDTDRFVYDEYRKEKLSNEETDRASKQEGQAKTTTHTRKVKVKRKVNRERRVYIKGEIILKFYGLPVEELNTNIFREEFYRIFAFDAEITILEKDICPLDSVPPEHSKMYSETELFKTPINQPLKCHVYGEATVDYFYLILQDIRIVNPIIYDVTKSEGESYGTLKGEVYGFVQHYETEEIEEEATEYFGATGEREKKAEDGVKYSRSEFYYSDGSTFWGPWERVFVATTEKKTSNKGDASFSGSSDGCFSSMWILIAFFFLVFFAPALLFPVFIIAAILLLSSLGNSILQFIASIFRAAGWLLLFLFLFWGVRSYLSPIKITRPATSPRTTKIITSEQPVVTSTKGRGDISDSLISHYIKWDDFNNNHYTAILSVLKSDFFKSADAHQNMNIPLNSEEDFSKVYFYLYQLDKGRLRYIYMAFDSIKTSKNLDDTAFANMMVSCVQNFPYTLVLNFSCNGDYNDAYVLQYLSDCSGDCCVGNEKYGVRSPVEFLSDLRGDCDTRALLLFMLFKYFHYDVALLTSSKYKHALIAVHFHNKYYPYGVRMSINNQSYLLWETTNVGFRPGLIPYEVSDLRYWRVSLLSNN